MEYLEEARARFAGDIYATEVTGIAIDEAAPDYCSCSLSLEPKHRNAAGSVMGGVLFTLADFTFAVAANTGHGLTVSLGSSISFLNATRGSVLYSKTRCIKSGRRSCVYEIMIRDDLGKDIACVTATGFRSE